MALANDTPQEAAHTLPVVDNERKGNRGGAGLSKTAAICGAGGLVAAPEGWPWRGALAFKDVRLRYRPGLEPALRGLTFSVAAGTRCGVVGRTGAGKSTVGSDASTYF